MPGARCLQRHGCGDPCRPCRPAPPSWRTWSPVATSDRARVVGTPIACIASATRQPGGDRRARQGSRRPGCTRAAHAGCGGSTRGSTRSASSGVAAVGQPRRAKAISPPDAMYSRMEERSTARPSAMREYGVRPAPCREMGRPPLLSGRAGRQKGGAGLCTHAGMAWGQRGRPAALPSRPICADGCALAPTLLEGKAGAHPGAGRLDCPAQPCRLTLSCSSQRSPPVFSAWPRQMARPSPSCPAQCPNCAEGR